MMKALPDEPTFTLLARDPTAPALVARWVALNSDAEIRAVLKLIAEMIEWRTPENLARISVGSLPPPEALEIPHDLAMALREWFEMQSTDNARELYKQTAAAFNIVPILPE